MKAIFAPDTSFFLQFRQPSELPWSELTPAKEVELVVLTAVLRELDNHSHGSNARRRRVAERVLKSVRELVPGQVVVVKEKNPRVYFSEHDAPDPSAIIPTWIDTSKADEAALAEVLEYRATGLAQLELLTADFTQLRLARRAGVAALMPPDSWKLPPEPDPSERRLAELERQMRLVQGRAPEIRVWPEVADVAVETIELTMQRFRPLTPAFVRQAMAEVQRKHPDQTVVRTGITVIAASGIETYTTQRNEWLEAVQHRLENLHVHLNIQHGQVELDLCLENSGAAIATGFVVEVDAEGSFNFVDTGHPTLERLMAPLELAQPPKLRSAHDFPLLDRLFPAPRDFPDSGVDLRNLYRPDPDSPDFDWSYEEALVAQVKGICGQFRRGRRPERETLTLFVPADVEIENEIQGRLAGWFTADNLVEQGGFGFPVRLTPDWQDTEAAAVALLEEHLQVQL